MCSAPILECTPAEEVARPPSGTRVTLAVPAARSTSQPREEHASAAMSSPPPQEAFHFIQPDDVVGPAHCVEGALP